MHNLFRNVEAVVGTTNIAATTVETAGKIIDTLGFGGVAFLLTAAPTTLSNWDFHAEMADTTATTDMVDVEDSKTNFDDTLAYGLALLDLGRPRKRYYRPYVYIDTANLAFNVTGLLYNPVQAAVTQDSTDVGDATYLYFETTGASSGS